MFLLFLCLGTILAPSKLPAELLSTPLVWVHHGGVVPPLQPLYNGPYAVLHHGPHFFAIRVESWDEVIAVSCLKACTAACVVTADCKVLAQAVLPQPSRSHFQTCWYLHLPLRRCLEMVLEPFSYPARRFLHARDQRCHHR